VRLLNGSKAILHDVRWKDLFDHDQGITMIDPKVLKRLITSSSPPTFVHLISGVGSPLALHLTRTSWLCNTFTSDGSMTKDGDSAVTETFKTFLKPRGLYLTHL
jgi:hypothetical protein